MPLKISWIFQGQENKEVTSTMGIETQKFGKRTNMLSIENIAQFHMGNYTCVATNNVGSASHSAELIVQGLNFLIAPLQFALQMNIF